MLNEHLFIVFSGEHYNPLGVVRSLGESGIKSIAIVVRSKEKITSVSRYIKKLHLVDSIQEGYEVLKREYGNKQVQKSFIFTTDADNALKRLDRSEYM